MNASDLVETHFTRLKPEQKRALHKLGIRTIRDLLYHFPARYESSGEVGTIAGISAGADPIDPGDPPSAPDRCSPQFLHVTEPPLPPSPPLMSCSEHR
jgi:hypothetical protein